MRKTLLSSWLVCVLVSTLAFGAIVEKPVDYQAGDVAMKGVLIYDDAVEGARPAVVVVPEWWGVNEYVKRRGRMLAELGYAAFVADMYGDGKVTTDAAQAGEWAGAVRGDRALMRERVNAAVAAARQQDVVDDAKVAAIGYCFGGTTVLELALSGSDVKGVASFHGGLDFPSLENDAGNVKSQVLVLHGAADPMVPPAQVEALEKALTDAGVKHEIVQYEGAVHSFTNPDAGKAGIDGVEYHEQADKESWEKLQEFLKQIFG